MEFPVNCLLAQGPGAASGVERRRGRVGATSEELVCRVEGFCSNIPVTLSRVSSDFWPQGSL